MSRRRYTKEQVKQALIACNGLLYLAAEKLGCTSATVINYMNRHPSIRRVVLEKRGKRVDVGEAALDKAVLNGESWAVQFLLRTQAKDRGYVERQEIAHGTVRLEITEEIVDTDRAQDGGTAPGPIGIPQE